MASILIVEDEYAIALDLKMELIELGYDIAGMADDFASCLAACKKDRPDLVLMDIQLKGDRDCIETSEFIKDTFKIPIIYLTAQINDSFFERAKKTGAFAYLTKPFNPLDLKHAIALALEANSKADLTEAQGSNDTTPKAAILHLNTGDAIERLDVNTILYCKSENNYTTFYLENEEKILISKTLKTFEKELDPFSFFRCHQSYLINLHHIKRYKKTDGGWIIMSNDAEIPVSRQKKESLLKWFNEK